MILLFKNFPCQVLLTSKDCINGSERISKNIHLLPEIYKYIINIQGVEPYVSEKNIDYAIEKHLKNNDEQLFYTTLHEETNSEEYLSSSASIKLISDLNNNVLYYSRNIIPWNKHNEIKKDFIYKTFTGIYVFNREKITLYHTMNNTPLQMNEDYEQLKILEHGYKIKKYSIIDYNEISLNTYEDYQYLLNKYSKNNNVVQIINNVKNDKIKFVCFELDGVFTDGKIYVDDDFNKWIQYIYSSKFDKTRIHGGVNIFTHFFSNQLNWIKDSDNNIIKNINIYKIEDLDLDFFFEKYFGLIKY